jgi:hypothetical protein
MMKRAALVILFLPAVASSQQVPTVLFGVEVGRSYEMALDGSIDLPVSEVTGYTQFIGTGVHVFFRPSETSSMFPYIEYPEEGNEAFATSYRAYLLPVIPESVESLDDLDSLTEYQAVLVQWSDSKASDREAWDDYWWARNMCRSIESDLNVEPDISDYIDTLDYTCRFTNDRHELEVTSVFEKAIRLSLRDTESTEVDIESKIRRLEMDRDRPYQLPPKD